VFLLELVEWTMRFGSILPTLSPSGEDLYAIAVKGER
jgi:hypothetical protein